MNNLVSFGNNRSYDDFKKQITPRIQPLFDSLRDFCLSLGKNVIEDVRMHRVVFCKSITFRWFVDIEPAMDHVILKIQKNRKEPQIILQIKPAEDINKVKELLHDAYNKIH